MTMTPIYDGTVTDQGWSPEELSPPLDLDTLIAASYVGPRRPVATQGEPQARTKRRTPAKRPTTTTRKPRARQRRTQKPPAHE